MHENRKAVLDVLQGKVPERRPVWLMRQAGRYLPEYRAIRTEAESFLKMCLTPDLATEITLQPIRRFDMDAAILFADILLVPMALGQGLEFREGEGPVLDKIETAQDLDQLIYDAERVAPVFETVRRVKQALPDRTTLIGFCGAPWTVASYMIDGNSKQDFALARSWVEHAPEKLDRLMAILVEASESYLSAQIDAGAECLQIFDSWAGLLTGGDFNRFVIEPTRALVTRMKAKYPQVPIIGFPREASSAGYSAYVRQTGIDGMSIDFNVDVNLAKQDWQSVKPLQGNLDPALLVEGGAPMRHALAHIMQTFGPKHIMNLGHGVVPQTPPEHVAEMVKFIREYAS